MGVGLLVGLAAVIATVAVLARRAEPFLRARIVAELQEHFHARVELDSFHIALVNGLWAEGKGLRIWPPAKVAGATGPTPDEPLIRLDEFRFHAPLRYQPGQPIHVQMVELKGLSIKLPPKSHFGHVAADPLKPGGSGLVHFEVEQLECMGAHMVMGTSKPGKQPLEFAIAHFKLTNIASDGSMNFDTELTNPRPVGTIHSTGRFGPWQVSDPGESPITGDYRFDHADLSVFKGIAGILDSTGHYQGTLRELVADGDANVPDFRLSHFGNTLPLNTHFHARVDGTNGDTWLEPVEATLGHSHFTAAGQIVRVPGSRPNSDDLSLRTAANITPDVPILGHDIALDVNVSRARIEDFLRLASRSPTPLLTGDLTLKAALHIPPGAVPVHERMNLTGAFALDQVRFSSPKIQDRIEQLSLRGQGRPSEIKTTDPASIRSQMVGRFDLGGGVLNLSALTYTVPGANIQLKGAYGLEGGTLNFAGTARMQATVSKMVGGWKGLLLKPADRFFQKNGAGLEVPIRIEGTREEPKFGIGLERSKSGTGASR